MIKMIKLGEINYDKIFFLIKSKINKLLITFFLIYK